MKSALFFILMKTDPKEPALLAATNEYARRALGSSGGNSPAGPVRPQGPRVSPVKRRGASVSYQIFALSENFSGGLM
jgi:hypothetical protein